MSASPPLFLPQLSIADVIDEKCKLGAKMEEVAKTATTTVEFLTNAPGRATTPKSPFSEFATLAQEFALSRPIQKSRGQMGRGFTLVYSRCCRYECAPFRLRVRSHLLGAVRRDLAAQAIPGGWVILPAFGMNKHIITTWLSCRLCLTLAALSAVCVPSGAQSQNASPDPGDPYRNLILPRGFAEFSGASFQDSQASDSWARCPLFRMPTGLSSEVLSLDDTDNDPTLGGPDVQPAGANALDDRRWQFALGSDNPYFDFRRPGDWGGIGFYRLQSQYLFVDNRAACLGLGFQAVTPAGIDAGGLQRGPTVLCPHLACFYELGGGTAIQGFVAKSVYAHSDWSDSPGRSIRYGMALERPFPGLESDPNPRAHIFLVALGRNRFDGDLSQRSSTDFDLVPGVHWRLREGSWISSGVLMPLDGLSPARLLWQLTCSWRY